MNVAGLAGSFWPSERQELLLRTAFGDDTESTDAWERVHDRLDLERLEPGTYPLLPLVHRALARLDVDDPAVPRLAGIRKRTWTLNQLLVEAASRALQALEAADAEPIVVGGWEIPTRYLGDLGLRPLEELTVLVRPDVLAAATDALHAAGLQGPVSSARQRFRFADEEGRACVVRLRLAAEFSAAEHRPKPEDVWSETAGATLDGTPLRALGPADELVVVCLDGARTSSAPYVLWVADALAVLTCANAEVDWHRVLRQARSLRATPRLHDALAYLGRIGATVPESVLGELAASPTRRRARFAYRAAAGAGRVPAPQAVTRFLQVTADRSVPGALAELPAVLRDELGLETRAQVPAAVLRRLVRPRPRSRSPLDGTAGRRATPSA